MKSSIKKLLVFLLVLVMSFSLFAVVACNNNNNDDDDDKGDGVYTVKVVDATGAPYTTAKVQLCKVESNGSVTTCYNAVATDSNGVAKLTIGKEIPAGVNEVEVHLVDLPANLTFEAVRIKKNETATVTVKDRTPLSGTGAGSLIVGSSQIDTDTFDPYVVEEGGYKFKFTYAEQKIYYAFHTEESAIYKVYSVGSVDASVTQLLGTLDYMQVPSEPEYKNDNVSATDVNFSYEFVVGKNDLDAGQGTAKMYFEIALENEDDLNKEALIYFEYVDDYNEKPDAETRPVEPKETLTAYANQAGTYIDLDLDGIMTCVKGSDGKYHVNSADGPVVVATLGKDDVLPRLLDKNFIDISETQPLAFYNSEDKVYYNYYPLVEAYYEVTNDDGRYPLTDELIEFFTLYINEKYTLDLLERAWGSALPEGKAWMVWCGYYQEIVIGGDGTSEEEAINLTEGELSVTVPASGSVYYSYYSNPAVTYVITSDDSNVKITVYRDSDPDGKRVFKSSDVLGLYVWVEAEPWAYYYFVFSTEDGSSATYTVEVNINVNELAEADGSADHPFVIENLGWIPGGFEEASEGVQDIFYTYTVTEEDNVLYFYHGANAHVHSVTYAVGDIPSEKLYEELKDGLSIANETVITIIVSVDANVESYSFYADNGPRGVKNNTLTLDEGTNYVEVDDNGAVYFSVLSFADATYIITSDSTNIKLTVYKASAGEQGATEYTSDEDGFFEEIAIEGSWDDIYYFVFSTKNDTALDYSVLVHKEVVEEEDELGSENNPIVIEALGTITNTSPEFMGSPGDLYYQYTVTADDATLYFEVGDETFIVVKYTDAEGEEHFLWQGNGVNELDGGLSVPVGTVLLIQVSRASFSVGEVSFTISNSLNAD